MTSRKDLRRYGAAVLALAWALGWLAGGTPSEARHDPLRIIFTQAKEKPNIYIVLDESGSLHWWPDYNHSCRPVRPPGASSDITLVVDGDFTVKNPYCGTSSPGCTGHGYWALAWQDASFSYWYFVPPSRAAMIKNFFGNCVTIWEVKKEWADNVPPCPATPVCQGVDSKGVRYFRFPRNGGPTGGAYLDKTTGGVGTWKNYTCNSSTTQEPPGDPTYTRPRPPYRFVERNRDLAFWGMARFTTAVGGIHNASRVTPALPTDNNSNVSAVTAINNEMGTDLPKGACSGNNGFTPGGGTPTQGGLNFSKREIDQWFNGDSAGQFCKRPYYVILLTDGQSNVCNPSNGEWGNSCTGWNNPSASQYWTKMPPGRADDLFLMKAPPAWTTCWQSSPPPGDKSPLPVQTFAVGVSPAVARCELNLVAYMGRTDASREDAGVRWQDNTDRAPQNTSDPTTLTNYWAAPRSECSACPPGTKPDPNRTDPNCQAKCGDYAFFANNPDELQNAFNKILAGILAGDYSMGTSTSVGGDVTATLGSVLVPSTQIPSWRGSLRHWETVPCDTPPPPGTSFVNVTTIKFNELCQKLDDPTITIISGIPQCGPAAGNPQNLPYFRLRWDAACSLLKQADPTQPDYKRAIYTVSSACGRANPLSGPSPECQVLKKLVKGDAALRGWLRTNVTTVNWSSLDLNGNGTPASTDDADIDMLIDFILGGDGSGTKRAWLLGDLVGSSPVIVVRPDTYISGTVPPKTLFDALVQNRPPMAYVTANDGLLHAFELKHDPRDTTSPPIERFAFLPPQAFPAVVQLFQNYRSYVQQGKNIPTGQAEVPNFDDHIWTMSAPLNTADVWVRWWPDAIKWRTLVLVPMGPKIPGLYALDVSNPAQDPSRPFSVLWYWDGAEARASACLTCDKVWSGVPIAPSFHGGKVIDGSFYQNWMVGVVTTSSEDTHVKSYATFLAADTGQLDPFNRSRVWPGSLPTCDPSGNSFCVPFHVYGNMAMQSADVDVNRPDTLATHAWFADTLGKVPMEWIADPNATLWRPNSPFPILDMGSTQPIYFTPALAHALGRKAMLMATATGSILETDGDVNDKNKTFCGSGQFCTFVQLDLFKVADTKDLQPDPSLPLAKRQARFQMAKVTVKLDADCDGDGVDDDGDGQADECDGTPMIDRTLSQHTRVTARPLIITESFRKTGGRKAQVLFLLYDPMVFNAEAGACTGESFLFPIHVEFEESAGGSVGFTTPSTSWTWGQQLRPLQSLGLTPVMGITAVAGSLVVVRTGYGEAIAAPYSPHRGGPNPNPPVPQLRGVKRIQ